MLIKCNKWSSLEEEKIYFIRGKQDLILNSPNQLIPDSWGNSTEELGAGVYQGQTY